MCWCRWAHSGAYFSIDVSINSENRRAIQRLASIGALILIRTPGIQHGPADYRDAKLRSNKSQIAALAMGIRARTCSRTSAYKKPLTPLPVTDAVGHHVLHRHAAARAAVAVAENYNWFLSFHVPLIFDGTTNLVLVTKPCLGQAARDYRTGRPSP